MDDQFLLKLEIARLLRFQREAQLAECSTVVFSALEYGAETKYAAERTTEDTVNFVKNPLASETVQAQVNNVNEVFGRAKGFAGRLLTAARPAGGAPRSGSSSEDEGGDEEEEGGGSGGDVRSMSKIELLEKQLEELRRMLELQQTMAAFQAAGLAPATPAPAAVAPVAEEPTAAHAHTHTHTHATHHLQPSAAQVHAEAAAPRAVAVSAPAPAVASTPQRPSMVNIMSAAQGVQLRRTTTAAAAAAGSEQTRSRRSVGGAAARPGASSGSAGEGLAGLLKAAMDKKFGSTRRELQSPLSTGSRDSGSDFGSPASSPASSVAPMAAKRNVGAASSMAVLASRRASRGSAMLQPVVEAEEEAQTARDNNNKQQAQRRLSNLVPLPRAMPDSAASMSDSANLLRRLAAADDDAEEEAECTAPAPRPRASSISSRGKAGLKKSVSFGANTINMLPSSDSSASGNGAATECSVSAVAAPPAPAPAPTTAPAAAAAPGGAPRPPMALLSAIKSLKKDEDGASAAAAVLKPVAANPAPAAAAPTAAPKGGMLAAIKGFDRGQLKKSAPAADENKPTGGAGGNGKAMPFASPSKGRAPAAAAAGLTSPGGFNPADIGRVMLRKTGAKLA